MSQKVLLLQFVRQLYDKSMERHGEDNTETLALLRYMDSLEGDIRRSETRPRHRPLANVYPLARSSAFAGRVATAGIWRSH
jgi:hypothetical protein